MKKSEEKLLGKLVLVGIVVYPFVWLYQKIGMSGYVWLIVGIIGIWIFFARVRKARVRAEFERDALTAIRSRITPECARAMNLLHTKTSYRHAELLRLLQIFADSVELALTSRKRDTAESRMILARETYFKTNDYRNIMGSRLRLSLEQKYQDAESRFMEVMSFNVAQGLIEKADSLKTEKSKMRYLGEALSVLEEALAGGVGNTTLRPLAVELSARMQKSQ